MVKLKRYWGFLAVGLLVFSCLSIVIGSYLSNFWSRSISDSPADWGVFGDYLGGTLNSAFSFFSFLALLYTIFLQQKELALTRDELKASTKAQIDASIFAGEQNKITSLQLTNAKNNEKKNDIYNLIKLVDEKIKNALNEKVDDFKIEGIQQQLSDFIVEAGDYLDDIYKGDKYHRRIKNNKNQLDNIRKEIKYLFKVIEEFDSLSESRVIGDYYESVSSYPIIGEIIDSLNSREDLW